jgi:hypothetical protein
VCDFWPLNTIPLSYNLPKAFVNSYHTYFQHFVQTLTNNDVFSQQHFLNNYSSFNVVSGPQVYDPSTSVLPHSTLTSGLSMYSDTYGDTTIMDMMDLPVVNLPEPPVEPAPAPAVVAASPPISPAKKKQRMFIRKAINPFSKPKVVVNPFAKRAQKSAASPRQPPKPVIKIHPARPEMKTGKTKISVSDYKKRRAAEKRVRKSKAPTTVNGTTGPVAVPAPVQPTVQITVKDSDDEGNLMIDENYTPNNLEEHRKEFEMLLAELAAMPVSDHNDLAEAEEQEVKDEEPQEPMEDEKPETVAVNAESQAEDKPIVENLDEVEKQEPPPPENVETLPTAVEENVGNEPKADDKDETAKEDSGLGVRSLFDDHGDSDLDYEADEPDDCLAICASPT